MEFFRLVQGVRLRRESFGGLVYDPHTGTTVELDRGAHRLAELFFGGISLEKAHSVILNENLEAHPCREEMQRVVKALCDLAVIEPAKTPQRPSTRRWRGWRESPACIWRSEKSGLSAPEAVHWAVTYRCDAGCPDCYAARHKDVYSEASTSEALDITDKIADWGAFQLAIGGGEPLVREDIGTLVRRASERGLSVHMTTSGDHLTRPLLETLSRWLTCLQIGIRHHDLLAERPRGQARRLSLINDEARTLGLSVGANLMLCSTVLQRLEDAIGRVVAAGFRHLTLLRYKPPASLVQWDKEAPDVSSLSGVEERIAGVVARHPDLKIRIDCGLAFLERSLRRDKANKAGLRGCVAGSRIAAVTADGSIYPCSQLVGPPFCAGHILRDDPADVWTGSDVLSRMRAFRLDPNFAVTSCGKCRAVEHCGGCRVFARDGLGADPGCPGPVASVAGARVIGD